MKDESSAYPIDIYIEGQGVLPVPDVLRCLLNWERLRCERCSSGSSSYSLVRLPGLTLLALDFLSTSALMAWTRDGFCRSISGGRERNDGHLRLAGHVRCLQRVIRGRRAAPYRRKFRQGS